MVASLDQVSNLPVVRWYLFLNEIGGFAYSVKKRQQPVGSICLQVVILRQLPASDDLCKQILSAMLEKMMIFTSI